MTLKNKRRVLLAGSLAFFLLCLLLPGQWGKLVVLVVGALALLGFLYCNMGELTQVEEGSPKLGVLKQTVIFSVVLLVLAVGLVWLDRRKLVDERGSELLCAGLICLFMLFAGNIAPKLPFNRYVGFRLPWTVTDEDTWILSHRLVGYAALPLAVLYLAGVLSGVGHFPALTGGILLLWLGIPGVLSLIFYYKKFHPKK